MTAADKKNAAYPARGEAAHEDTTGIQHIPAPSQLLEVIGKNDVEQLQIALNEFRGGNYVDIRYFAKRHGRVIATPKGVTIAATHLPKLIAALERGKALAEAGGG